MCKLLYLIASFLNLLANNEAARILAIFPIPCISHQAAFRPFTQELAKRGHNVTIITTDPAFGADQPKNVNEIDIHEMAYKLWKENFVEETSTKSTICLRHLEISFNLGLVIFKKIAQIKEVRDMLENATFDLIISDACSRPALSLSNIFKAPVIQISSLGSIIGNYEYFGAPIHSVLYPRNFQQRIFNVTTSELLIELYREWTLKNIFSSYETTLSTNLKRILNFENYSQNKAKESVNLLYLNIHPIWDDCRPVPPQVIYIGGFSENSGTDLPKDLKSYLDSSANGVIYMSFGTSVSPSLLPPEKIQIFIKVFSQLPYDVLLKWDRDELPKRPENVKISKWFPQANLLRHPKIKLFITQAGQQSTDEAIFAGVPLIGVPMIFDQWHNAEKYVHHKIGKKLEFLTLTEDELKSAIENVIGDESYRHNIVKLRTLMLDQPQRPLDRAVWWTEYVLRHGGTKHLRALATNIHWTEYYEFYFLSYLILLVLFAVAVSLKVLNFFFKLVKNIINRPSGELITK